MNTTKVFWSTIILILLIGFVSLAYARRIFPNQTTIPGARTLYTGSVHIHPVSLTQIKKELQAQGCYESTFTGQVKSKCRYNEAVVPYNKQNGILIFPHGFGFGPLSFYITEDTLWDVKDIASVPDIEKYKKEVRVDVQAIQNIVQIKEGSWILTETKYPWTAVY